MNSANRIPKLKSASGHEQSCLIVLPLLAVLALAHLAAPVAMDAGTIWTGTSISFSKSGGDDPTQPANQDRITPNVWLTRGGVHGIYNIKTESFFTHFSSPADTEWADGTTANTNLTYVNWNTWAKGVHLGPPSTVGVDAVLHLISDDIYIDIKFTAWSSGGDFSYQRSTPRSVVITNPANGASFIAPATVTIAAIARDSYGTVTNVEFFSGATSLGNVTSAPFNFTYNNLAAGNYTFTAKALDNLGEATTSAPVNIFLLTNAVASAPAGLTDGLFVLTISGIAGQTYTIEASTNLSAWTPILTNVAPANVFNVTDFTSTNVLLRFYRTRQDF
jgi:hypothetical protein